MESALRSSETRAKRGEVFAAGGQFAGTGANLFADVTAGCPPVPPLAEPSFASAFFSCPFVWFVDHVQLPWGGDG